jgi:glycosyltransferase involved in cell wall biosynthesis
MNERPLVSIVTPSLNQGRFIAEAIQSVLSQDYANLEYIVVDGGSSDETLSILRSFGERLRWISEKDEGQAQAVNKGWRMARGEILGWLNADDLLAADAVTRAVNALEAERDLAGVYGDCVYVNEAGDVLGNYPSGDFDYEKLAVFAEDFIPQPGAFLRRDGAGAAPRQREDVIQRAPFWGGAGFCFRAAGGSPRLPLGFVCEEKRHSRECLYPRGLLLFLGPRDAACAVLSCPRMAADALSSRSFLLATWIFFSGW